MTPEQLPAAAPRVSYRNGVLTVDSANSTLGAILNAIRRQTGAQIDTPPAGSGQRVAGHFSGSPRQVLSSLLDGSELGYAIIGAPDNPEHVQQVILMVQSRNGSPSSGPAVPSQNQAPTAEEDPYADLGPEEGPTPEQMNQRFPGGRQNPNGGGDQPGDTGIPNRPPHMPPSQNTQDSSQQQIKTPEQLLQELQRQRNHTAQ
jgi:hypothetical protein